MWNSYSCRLRTRTGSMSYVVVQEFSVTPRSLQHGGESELLLWLLLLLLRERCRCVRQPVSSPSGVAPPSPGCVPPLPRVARAPALSSATGLAELNRSPPLYLSPMVVGSPPCLAHPTPATSAAWLLRVASTSFLVCPVTLELSLSPFFAVVQRVRTARRQFA